MAGWFTSPAAATAGTCRSRPPACSTPAAASASAPTPAGTARPLAANVNFTSGTTQGNRVFAKLGTGGKVTIYNNAGSTDVIVDVSGYFTDASVAGPPASTRP